MTPLPEPLKAFAYLGGKCQDLYSEAQLRQYGEAEYRRGIEAEQALITTLQRTTEALNQATKERDHLAAALEATSLREAELTAELGDLPEAQADMLATIKAQRVVLEQAKEALEVASKGLRWFTDDVDPVTQIDAAITAIQEQLK